MKKPKKISKSFIFSLAGAVILLLQVFGIKIDVPYINKILEASCAALIVLGIVSMPASDAKEDGEYAGELCETDDVGNSAELLSVENDQNQEPDKENPIGTKK